MPSASARARQQQAARNSQQQTQAGPETDVFQAMLPPPPPVSTSAQHSGSFSNQYAFQVALNGLPPNGPGAAGPNAMGYPPFSMYNAYPTGSSGEDAHVEQAFAAAAASGYLPFQATLAERRGHAPLPTPAWIPSHFEEMHDAATVYAMHHHQQQQQHQQHMQQQQQRSEASYMHSAPPSAGMLSAAMSSAGMMHSPMTPLTAATSVTDGSHRDSIGSVDKGTNGKNGGKRGMGDYTPVHGSSSGSSHAWSPEDDERLRAAILTLNKANAHNGSSANISSSSSKSWIKIASIAFPDGKFNRDACSSRWRILTKPPSIKGPWSPEEDQKLHDLVIEFGPEKWITIAQQLGTRSGKQCRERWHNHVNPDIKKGPFTPDEDSAILRLFHDVGSKWAYISKYLPGRTDNAIKNHYNTVLVRRAKLIAAVSNLKEKGIDVPASLQMQADQFAARHESGSAVVSDGTLGLATIRPHSADGPSAAKAAAANSNASAQPKKKSAVSNAMNKQMSKNGNFNGNNAKPRPAQLDLQSNGHFGPGGSGPDDSGFIMDVPASAPATMTEFAHRALPFQSSLVTSAHNTPQLGHQHNSQPHQHQQQHFVGPFHSAASALQAHGHSHEVDVDNSWITGLTAPPNQQRSMSLTTVQWPQSSGAEGGRPSTAPAPAFTDDVFGPHGFTAAASAPDGATGNSSNASHNNNGSSNFLYGLSDLYNTYDFHSASRHEDSIASDAHFAELAATGPPPPPAAPAPAPTPASEASASTAVSASAVPAHAPKSAATSESEKMPAPAPRVTSKPQATTTSNSSTPSVQMTPQRVTTTSKASSKSSSTPRPSLPTPSRISPISSFQAKAGERALPPLDADLLSSGSGSGLGSPKSVRGTAAAPGMGRKRGDSSAATSKLLSTALGSSDPAEAGIAHSALAMRGVDEEQKHALLPAFSQSANASSLASMVRTSPSNRHQGSSPISAHSHSEGVSASARASKKRPSDATASYQPGEEGRRFVRQRLDGTVLEPDMAPNSTSTSASSLLPSPRDIHIDLTHYQQVNSAFEDSWAKFEQDHSRVLSESFWDGLGLYQSSGSFHNSHYRLLSQARDSPSSRSKNTPS